MPGATMLNPPDDTTPAASEHETRGRRKLGRPRLLVIGAGDIGLRIVARVRDRFRVIALTSTPERVPLLRAAGCVPIVGNLDRRASLGRLRGLAARLVHLAPPADVGLTDVRTRRLRAALGRVPPRAVYLSTTGVYGDRQGRWTDETTSTAPATERAHRRADAERQMRAAPLRATVLRVPGIYAHDRLPLQRLRQGLPVLTAADDVHTSHVHADDLARIAIAALWRGRAARVINAVDDSQLAMGEYFDRIADALGLPRPPRLPRDQLRRVVSPVMYSFMAESRRLRNHRLHQELRVRLRWPTVAATLADLQARAAAPADGTQPSGQPGGRGSQRLR